MEQNEIKTTTKQNNLKQNIRQLNGTESNNKKTESNK